MNTFFITGIGTDVGKTLISAIVVEALQADYWKPVQAGDLQNSDTHKVKRLVSNSKSHFFENAYALKTPMSPHAAAEIDQVHVDVKQIIRPKTHNNLVIEGAGGLLVPLNDKDCIIDLIEPNDKIILVSRHYLGSINHSLLSIEALQNYGFQKIGILFSGDEHPTTESIILKKSKVQLLGRIPELKEVNQESVSIEAKKLIKNLKEF
jgi:dethiobiotin synthetase